jgi:hypothetical protein
MIENIRIISLYKLLILQLVILSLSTKMLAMDLHEFLKIWHVLKILFLPKAKKKSGKLKESFWEIDMTKFEP